MTFFRPQGFLKLILLNIKMPRLPLRTVSVLSRIHRRRTRMWTSQNELTSTPRIDDPKPMDTEEWIRRGKQMVDYIAKYHKSIGSRRVIPAIEPGYLRARLPADPPEKSEEWDQVMADFDKHIVPGITHWQHPHFHAYFPSGNSYPSILADMLSDAVGAIGFSWAACPAQTELEHIMLDWVAKMLGLDSGFYSTSASPKSRGGGCIQGSGSDCTLIALLAARHDALLKLSDRYPDTEASLLSKLIAYTSKEGHSSIEKAAQVGFVKLRILPTNERFELTGQTLREAMDKDKENGLIPFFVATTLGTTSCCSFDKISEIGPICKEEDIWLHIDAAYAGSAFMCPEYRYLMKGHEDASSFCTNPNKWMLVNFDCSLLWVKDKFKLTSALIVEPIYLQHSHSDISIDYRHWGLPLSRRFRALKLWFVIRNYGVEGLQKYIRHHCHLAQKFAKFMEDDQKFEICNDPRMGLVCFRLKGSNYLNKQLLSRINEEGKLHMVPAYINKRYVIRFCVCSQQATEEHIKYAYHVVSVFANDLLEILKMDAKAGEDEQRKSKKTMDDSSDEEDSVLSEAIRVHKSQFVKMVTDYKKFMPWTVRLTSTNFNEVQGHKTEVREPLDSPRKAEPEEESDSKHNEK